MISEAEPDRREVHQRAASRQLDRMLRPFLDIRVGEGLTVLSMGLFFFLVVASSYLINPVRNSLFVQRVGADNLLRMPRRRSTAGSSRSSMRPRFS